MKKINFISVHAVLLEKKNNISKKSFFRFKKWIILGPTVVIDMFQS